MKDSQMGKLLAKLCFTQLSLTIEEKEVLYYQLLKEIKKNRLRRFIDLNYVLLVVCLLIACSCIAVLVTGYDGNQVLFYVCCAANLILCCYTLGKSFCRLREWLLCDNKEKKSE